MANYIIKNKIKCPKCGKLNPDIIDYYVGHTVTFSYNEETNKYDEGNLEIGDLEKHLGKCNSCKHIWTLRNS